MAEDCTFPPLDVPKPLTDGVWVVDSARSAPRAQLPIRMTVLRLADGGRGCIADAAHAGVAGRLGAARLGAALDRAQHRALGARSPWQKAFPRCRALGGAGCRGPRAWRRTCICAPPAPGRCAATRLARADRARRVQRPRSRRGRASIITRAAPGADRRDTGDAIRRPAAGVAAVRPRHRLGRGGWRNTGAHPAGAQPSPRANRLAAERLLALRPERVVFAHGAFYATDGTARLRRALEWLLQD